MSSAPRSLKHGAAIPGHGPYVIEVPARPGMFDGWRSPFRLCGYAGLVCGVALAFLVAERIGLSFLTVAAIAVASLLTFFALASVVRVITGEEVLVYHQHEIAILGVASVVAWLTGAPLLSSLDVTILGLGAFLACGRVGCLLVGCCHGRPHAWGVCYGSEHAHAGFAPYYVGVSLFPVQALESILVAAIVLVGCIIILCGGAPGSALAWYLAAYSVGRFALEFLRGDPERRFHAGFSEAQWVSLIIAWIVAIGVERHQIWYLATAIAIGIAMIAVALLRSRAHGDRDLLHPHHVREIAEIPQAVAPPARSGDSRAVPLPGVVATSRGIAISAGSVEVDRGALDHYAFSSLQAPLSYRGATSIARLLLQIRHHAGRAEMVPGAEGVFHLLVHPLGNEATPS